MALETTVPYTTAAGNLDNEDWRQGYLNLCEQEVKDRMPMDYDTQDSQGRPILHYNLRDFDPETGMWIMGTRGEPMSFYIWIDAPLSICANQITPLWS